MLISTIAAIVLLSTSSAYAAKCSVKNGDLSARWQVVDGELTMEVTTKNLGNNEWSAVGFGPDMSDLVVVLFEVVNNQPKLETGVTKGYGPPEIDSSNSVVLQSLNYNSNTFVARFARPVGSLSSCTTWNFVTGGTIEDGELGYHNDAPQVLEICANKSQPLNNGQVTALPTPDAQVTDVCPTQCTQIFDERNLLTDPVPTAAIYNNRISNRFDALFDGTGSRKRRAVQNIIRKSI